MLRHESVATTEAHYIKDVPENTRNAMQGIEQRIRKLASKRAEQQASAEQPQAEQSNSTMQ